MNLTKLLAGAALLVLAGCGGEEPAAAPSRNRTEATPLAANLCPAVVSSSSPELALEEDRHSTRNETDPTYAFCVLRGVDPEGTAKEKVAVTAFVRSYGDRASDQAADRVDEELARQCDQLAEEHPETQQSADGTCSYHATTEVAVGGFDEASTATAVVRLPKVHGVVTVNLRFDGDDAGRSRAEALATGQRLAAADLGS